MQPVLVGRARLVEQAGVELVVRQEKLLPHEPLVPADHAVDARGGQVAEHLGQVLEDAEPVGDVLPEEAGLD